VQDLTLKSVALGFLLSAVCTVVDCGSGGASRGSGSGGTSALDASRGGQGGAQEMPGNYAGTSASGVGAGGASSSSSSGSAGDSQTLAGAAGEGTSEGGAPSTPDAGLGVQDAALDAESADAKADASEEGGAGGASDDAGKTPAQDAATPPIDCSPPQDTESPDDAGVGTRAQVQGILDGACVYCHSLPTPPENLVLTDVSAVVGTHSMECTDKLRIQAGSAQNSYLVDKLRGGAQSPCGCFMGQQMPLDDDPLSADNLRIITSWINAGAQ
jgi:hypothetical protein